LVDICYDPNRKAYLGLVNFIKVGLYIYILLPDGLKKGSLITFHTDLDLFRKSKCDIFKIGDSRLLKVMPISAKLHNVEFKPGGGGQIARAAGTSAKIVRKFKFSVQRKFGFVGLKLPSGKFKYLLDSCLATLGRVSNFEEKLVKKWKAGTNARLGVRPKVRGVAMNPVDHPHGGGEGKTSGGRISVSKWGLWKKGFCNKN